MPPRDKNDHTYSAKKSLKLGIGLGASCDDNDQNLSVGCVQAYAQQRNWVQMFREFPLNFRKFCEFFIFKVVRKNTRNRF